MTTAQITAEPHAIIAWHALSLLAALNKEEHLVIDQQKRADLAALLGEAARTLANSAHRLCLSPHQAEALRHLQINQPTQLS